MQSPEGTILGYVISNKVTARPMPTAVACPQFLSQKYRHILIDVVATACHRIPCDQVPPVHREKRKKLHRYNLPEGHTFVDNVPIHTSFLKLSVRSVTITSRSLILSNRSKRGAKKLLSVESRQQMNDQQHQKCKFTF